MLKAASDLTTARLPYLSSAFSLAPASGAEGLYTSAITPALVSQYEKIHISDSGFRTDLTAISLIVGGYWISLESNPACGTKRTQTAMSPAHVGLRRSSTQEEKVCASFHFDSTPNEIDLTSLTKEQLKSLSGEVRVDIRQLQGSLVTSQGNVCIKSSEMTWTEVTDRALRFPSDRRTRDGVFFSLPCVCDWKTCSNENVEISQIDRRVRSRTT